MYIENNQIYNELPKWVHAMILLGYNWERERNPWKRRVGLVSMPCKSNAAPLISLGALIKDLERENANEINGHFEYLSRSRDAYLNDPDNTNGIIIDKNHNKWKFSGVAGEEFITVVDANYKELVKRKGRLILNPDGQCKSFITPYNANEWRFKGESLVEIKDNNSKLNKSDYQFINGVGDSIIDNNLLRSYAGLLLVGGGEGKNTAYMQEIYNTCFQVKDKNLNLADLLTIHPDEDGVSRILFCNHLKIEQCSNEHYLVIADGAGAFSKSLSCFRNSDVIGIYSRDEPDENLEKINNMINEIKRYYSLPKEIDIPLKMPSCISTWSIERS